MSERNLHRSVKLYLELALTPATMFLHIPNGEKRDIATAKALKTMGVRAGAADFLVVNEGHAIWIELKSTSGRQSAAQKKFEHDAIQAGSSYHLCRSLEGVAAVLKAHAVPLRASLMSERQLY